MEEINNKPKEDSSSMGPFIAFLGILLFIPFGIGFSMLSFSELLRAPSFFEMLYWAIFIYVLGLIPLQVSFLLIKLIFASRGKRIIFKDSPKFSYFLKYYILLLPVFLVFITISLFFLTSFLNQFIKEGLPNSSWALFVLTALLISLWKLVQFSLQWLLGLTKIIIDRSRNK